MSLQVKRVFFRNYVFCVWQNVYEPSDDSFLFAENLKVCEGEKVLDLGTGCGILGIIAAKNASCVFAVDINPYAIRCAKENAKLNSVMDKMFFIQGDLFTSIKPEEKFDLILFNAPYLPSEPSEGKSWVRRAWDGGVNGRGVINRFIREVCWYVKPKGRVLLMQSTLADVDRTLKDFNIRGFETKIVAESELPFFETIVLIEAKRVG